MSGRPDPLRAVRAWVRKAESDFEAIEKILQEPKPGPYDAARYHAQQGAEKCLKALLVFHAVEAPKTHDLVVLFRLASAHSRLALTPEELTSLNDYIEEGRYPGDWDPIGPKEASEASALTKKIRAEVRRHLPKGSWN